MSARPLSVVPPEPDRHSAGTESPLTQWDCEHQLVGALLHLSATQAAPILNLVPDSAIWRPDNRWAYELIGHLVSDDRDPDPVLVLATARHRPPADAPRPRRPISRRGHHPFAVHLADLYTKTVTPAAVQQYAREVLDEAYRRAIALHGEHMRQMAENDVPRDDLTDYLTAMRAHLADLWRRGEAARVPKRAC
jgi:replicative DNA helicase